MRHPRGAACLAATLLVVSLAAAPSGAGEGRSQLSAAGQIGITGVSEGSYWSRTRLDLGLRVEDVFLRNGPRSFGLGPYLEARTAAFIHGDYGGGLVAVLPVDQTFPLWLGAGGFARRQGGTWAPGGNAFIAWGSRSYNYSSSYAMAFGLMLDVRVHGGELSGVDTVLAATIDLEGLALPGLYAVSALRH